MTKLLFPERRQQLDFFLCNLLNACPKDDLGSMEHPMFALSAKRDNKIRHYEHNGNSIEIAPSAYGRATIFDKDVVIYCVSQLIEGMNRSRSDVSRTVRVTAYELLQATNRNTDGRSYERLKLALDRLRGTSIKTNIATGNVRIIKAFGLIESYEIIEKSPLNNRMVALEITLSEWLFNAVSFQEVLSIHNDYFLLRKPLDRRLYEIARKHCGKQSQWSISLKKLYKKTGATQDLRRFRKHMVELQQSQHLPQYFILYNHSTQLVKFLYKDARKRLSQLVHEIG